MDFKDTTNFDGYKRQELRNRLKSIGLHLSLCCNFDDEIKLWACETKDELELTYKQIAGEISKVHRMNLALNHSNYRNL